MPLLHHRITFLNFDRTYEHQKKLTQALPHQQIDFTGLRGTSLYCSPQAFQSICEKFSDLPDKGLTFIGSGNYHYVALALMREIQEPFTLILFDHHTDLNEGQIGSLLSCGSWVHHAITGIPNLKKVIMIGPHPLTVRSVPDPIRRRTVIFPDEQLPSNQTLMSLIPTDHVQISIDKDVFSPKYAKTNWSQGKLTFDKFHGIAQLLLTGKAIESVDVCGGWPILPHEHLNPKTRQWIDLNEETNLKIARLLLRKTNHHSNLMIGA
ncbi:arginase [Sporolactobacillus shoreae]|uniref:Arginase n=1 Tax=Sporolactobacillus shoreae TaxID=1465501 RepID=A0A4Z0GKK3_9BACL|nr:arginase family protein [Sporolactobacillus shoreae]TGA96614.1 arginase [Sporolactobacillus shoreae]